MPYAKKPLVRLVWRNTKGERIQATLIFSCLVAPSSSNQSYREQDRLILPHQGMVGVIEKNLYRRRNVRQGDVQARAMIQPEAPPDGRDTCASLDQVSSLRRETAPHTRLPFFLLRAHHTEWCRVPHGGVRRRGNDGRGVGLGVESMRHEAEHAADQGHVRDDVRVGAENDVVEAIHARCILLPAFVLGCVVELCVVQAGECQGRYQCRGHSCTKMCVSWPRSQGGGGGRKRPRASTRSVGCRIHLQSGRSWCGEAAA